MEPKTLFTTFYKALDASYQTQQVAGPVTKADGNILAGVDA